MDHSRNVTLKGNIQVTSTFTVFMMPFKDRSIDGIVGSNVRSILIEECSATSLIEVYKTATRKPFYVSEEASYGNDNKK